MSASATAATTAALAAMVGLASFAPPAVLAVAVVLLGVMVAVGWPDLLALPSRRGTTGVLTIAAVAGSVAAVLTRQSASPQGLPTVVALAVLLAFVHQLLRRDGRPRLVESLTGSVTGQAVVILGASWVALPQMAAGAGFVAVVLASVVTASAVCAVGWPVRVAGPLSLLTGAVTGWAASGLAGLLGAGFPGDSRWTMAGLIAGMGSGLMVCGWRLHTARLPAAPQLPAALAVAAGPVALAGAGAFVVGRLLLG